MWPELPHQAHIVMKNVDNAFHPEFIEPQLQK